MRRLRSHQGFRYAAALWLAVMGVSGTARAQTGFTPPEEKAPEAPEILARMRAAFPPEPFNLEGELITRNADGKEEASQRVTLLLEWGARPPRARLAVADAFGATLATLTLRRPGGGRAEMEYLEGDPPQARPAPPAHAPIAKSEITWGDLGLDFLWWPGGQTLHTEMKKTRLCYVVDLPAPAGSPCAKVRLWVDAQAWAVLQADWLDGDNRATRRLEAKSIRKVDGRWMVQDVEVRNLVTQRTTTLRVTASRLGNEPPPAEPVAPVEPVDVPVAPAPDGAGD